MRKKYLDWLRAGAIIGVILVHVAGRGLNTYMGEFSLSWLSFPVWAAVGRVCVVVFVMISGATLLAKKEETLKDFFLKRWLRLLVVYIIWQVIYYVWWEKKLPSDLYLLTHEATYHLWYMRMILGVYLLVPILRKIVAKWNDKKVLMLMMGWTIVVVSASALAIKIGQYGAPLGNILSYGVILLWGYYLNKLIEQKEKRQNTYYWCIGIISWMWCMGIMTVGLVKSYTNERWFDERWHNNVSGLVILGGIGLFCAAASAEKWLPKLKIVSTISKTSFGIYLIHVVFWEYCATTFYFNGAWPNGWIGVPMVTGIVLILSWMSVMIYQQISTRLLTLLKKMVK